MAEKIKVLLVDDNRQVLRSLKEYFTGKSDLISCDTAENGIKATEFIANNKVDVMILDIIMPELDGFGVLDWLKAHETVSKPKVIVVTALGHEDIVRTAKEKGVRYFMMKPAAPEQLYNRVLEISGITDNKPHTEHSEVVGLSIDEQIISILLKMGIPANILGYKFLVEGIKKVIDRRELVNSITKKLYPEIANQFNTTASQVERSIRHAINIAGKNGEINRVLRFETYDNDKSFSNGEFIALAADRLILDNKIIK